MKGAVMDIKLWIAFDVIITLTGIFLFALVAPQTMFAFIPEQKLLWLMYGSAGVVAAGVWLANEIRIYIRKYGI